MGGRVEFLFQRGPIWQPGRVLRLNNDGTYVVRCEIYDQDSVVRILDDLVPHPSPGGRNNQEEEDEPRQEYYDEDEVLEDFYATLKEEEKHTGRWYVATKTENSLSGLVILRPLERPCVLVTFS